MPSRFAGGDEAIAGRFGVAGLQAVDARIAIEQAIAIGLRDLVPGELALRVPLVVLRIVANQRELPACRCRAPSCSAAARACRGCSRNACSPCRAAAHTGSSDRRTPARCRRRARPVRRSHRCPDCTIMPWIRFSTLTSVPTSTNMREPSWSRACALMRTMVVELDASVLERVEHGVGGHQLREARRLEALVFVGGCEHLRRCEVHEEVAARLDLRRRRNRWWA